jgi:(4S)-4-hydroxy-5-phosphonooxypentane-2,3-dione isomerase
VYTVISFTRVFPQHVDDYIENMNICAQKTNQEPGCIRYEVMQDVADPTLMFLYQVFQDEAAYKSHQDAEHHRVWIEKSGPWRDQGAPGRHELKYITPLSSR